MPAIIQTAGNGLIAPYAVIRKDGQPYNGSSFENENESNWTTYSTLDLSRTTNGKYWKVNFPAGLAAAKYHVTIYDTLGGSKSADNEVVDRGSFVFDGTNEVSGLDSESATALLDLAAGVETGITLRQALRLILSAVAGKLSGAATTTVLIRDTNDSKNRITATVDADGNRTAITLDAS
jgi:hypothetical protein